MEVLFPGFLHIYPSVLYRCLWFLSDLCLLLQFLLYHYLPFFYLFLPYIFLYGHLVYCLPIFLLYILCRSFVCALLCCVRSILVSKLTPHAVHLNLCDRLLYSPLLTLALPSGSFVMLISFFVLLDILAIMAISFF